MLKGKVAIKNAAINTGSFLTKIAGIRAGVMFLSKLGMQSIHTPFTLAGDMVGRVSDLEGKTIRVFFNLELLEELSRRVDVDMENVQFIADTPEEERFARLVFKGVDTVLMDEDTWSEALSMRSSKQLDFLGGLMAKNKFSMNKAADITFTNPPYNRSIDLKILMALLEAKLLKKLICVHPSSWLIDTKGKSSVFNKFQKATERHALSFDMFNGNPVFDIGLFVPCMISEFDFMSLRVGDMKVKYLGKKTPDTASKYSGITLHGEDWDTSVKGFMQDMVRECKKDRLLNHGVPSWGSSGKPNPKKYYIQLAEIRGTGNRGSLPPSSLVLDDFYTMLMKDPEGNRGVRKQEIQRASGATIPTYEFSTKAEQDNLISYLASDFVRMCLALNKTNQHTTNGEMDLIPWVDMTQSWDDDKLFSHFGYRRNHPIRKYAKVFLPDYYNLYPNGKTY